MFELNKRYKLHKAYLCFFVYNGIRTVFLPLLIIAIANLRYAKGFLRETGFSLPAALLLLTALIIALIFVFALISYSRYKWELTGSEIRIYKGVIFLKKIRIPFTRINTVETSAKLIERLFGLVSVRFDTAGGSNNKADAVLPMLRLDEAEALKAEIFNLRDGGTVAHEGIINDDAGAPTDPAAAVAAYNPATPGAAYDTVQSIGIAAGDVRGVLGGRDSDSVPIEYEYRLTGKEIFLAGIANSHALISVAVLFGILSGIYGYLDDFAGILNFDMGSAAADAASHVFGPLAGSRAIIIVIVFIVLIVFLIGYVMAVVSKFIAFGGFVIQKRGDRIEVQRGLLARKSSSIVTHRVQTVNVSQGLLMRLLGYAEVRAETASALATQNNNQKAQLEDSVIHPFIKLKNLDGFLAGVLPEFTDRPRELAPLTLRALRRSVTRYGVWSLIILGVPVVVIHHFEKLPGYVFAIAAALWILMLVCGALKWKGRAIGRTERTLAMRRGAVRRQVVYLKKPKIQHATKEVNPFQHAAQMATFSVYTAAAQGKRNAIKDLTTAAADDYLAWTEPGRKKIAISPEI